MFGFCLGFYIHPVKCLIEMVKVFKKQETKINPSMTHQEMDVMSILSFSTCSSEFCI
ncbi:hypothetical protein FQR65_LT07389 [Abscondita terminalis]|nr:hypothetical protein FQR65_LT07389 [Abscondita terminalis]